MSVAIPLKSWIEISEQALVANYRALTAAATTHGGPPTPVLAVVKANAYGQGLAVCAPVLAAAGAPWLGVTDAHEGVVARRAIADKAPRLAPQPEILLMSGLLPEDADAVLEHHLTPAIWTPLHLDWLESAARRRSLEEPAAVHLEVDTGMTRQGARPGQELEAVLDRITSSKHLRLGGVFTHFASSEVAASPQTERQQRLFEDALAQIRQHTIFCQPESSGNPSRAGRKTLEPLWIHASNSSALDLGASPGWLNQLAAGLKARPLARAGLALYGYTLPVENASSATSTIQPKLIPVSTWKTRILDLRKVPEGVALGYNGTYVTSAPTRVALLPVGYADGLRRELSSTSERLGGWAIAAGRRASFLGRISMNLSEIDVTGLPCRIGDEVTLLGPGASAEDHASLAGTIAYEILCGLRASPRVVE